MRLLSGQIKPGAEQSTPAPRGGGRCDRLCRQKQFHPHRGTIWPGDKTEPGAHKVQMKSHPLLYRLILSYCSELASTTKNYWFKSATYFAILRLTKRRQRRQLINPPNHAGDNQAGSLAASSSPGVSSPARAALGAPPWESPKAHKLITPLEHPQRLLTSLFRWIQPCLTTVTTLQPSGKRYSWVLPSSLGTINREWLIFCYKALAAWVVVCPVVLCVPDSPLLPSCFPLGNQVREHLSH